jgi:hypothetical protein
MNSHLSAAVVQSRQQDLQRAADAARVIDAIVGRPGPFARLRQSVSAPRPSLRLRSTGERGRAVGRA